MWFWIWIIVYLILIIVLTIRHVRSADLENYLVNNRNTRTLPLVFTTLATFVGGGTSIGLIAMGYESGFAAVGIGIAYVIGFFILSRFAAKIHDEGASGKIYSFPEFLNRKYIPDHDPTFAHAFGGVISGINIFIFFFLLAAQFVGMAALLEYSFDIGFLTAAIISCLVVIAYTAFAGLSGVIITDTVQFIIIIFMIIAIFIPGILFDTGNLAKLDELPDKFLDGTFYGIGFLVALPLFIAPSVLVRMDLWQRLLAARSGKVAKRVSILSGIGMLPFYLIFPLVGMAVRVVSTGSVDPKYAAYLFLDQHTTEVMLGFAVVGLLSALMSSGDSFLNIISISAVRDFLGRKKRSSSKKTIQKQIRVTTLIFGAAALVMALSLPRIVDLMVVGIATIVIFVPVTFLALVRKDVLRYRKAALASVISGFVVNLGFFLYGLFLPEQFELKSSFIPAFVVSLGVLALGVFKRKRGG
jgi:SSS family solute:Na+ symporter